jgi:hypothetical protein
MLLQTFNGENQPFYIQKKTGSLIALHEHAQNQQQKARRRMVQNRLLLRRIRHSYSNETRRSFKTVTNYNAVQQTRDMEKLFDDLLFRHNLICLVAFCAMGVIIDIGIATHNTNHDVTDMLRNTAMTPLERPRAAAEDWVEPTQMEVDWSQRNGV